VAFCDGSRRGKPGQALQIAMQEAPQAASGKFGGQNSVGPAKAQPGAAKTKKNAKKPAG
jgi:hypothetical protein